MIWWLPFSWLAGMPLGIAGYILLDRLLLQGRHQEDTKPLEVDK
jgi:hypothetical protein